MMAARFPFPDLVLDDAIVNTVDYFCDHINDLNWPIHAGYDITGSYSECNGYNIPTIIRLNLLTDEGDNLLENHPVARIHVHNREQLEARLIELFDALFDCFHNEEQRGHREEYRLVFPTQ